MLWNEVKKKYPNKWIIYVSVNQQDIGSNQSEEKLIIIEVFKDINEAYRFYCKINRKNRNSQVRIANTNELEIGFEFKKTSNFYSFKRAY